MPCALCGRSVGKKELTEAGITLHAKCHTVLSLLPAAAQTQMLQAAASLPTAQRPRLVPFILGVAKRARAGCIELHFCRWGTGPLIGVYLNAEAGMEIDPETPWSVVCEAHHTLVCCETKALAISTSTDTRNFCDDCRDTAA